MRRIYRYGGPAFRAFMRKEVRSVVVFKPFISPTMSSAVNFSNLGVVFPSLSSSSMKAGSGAASSTSTKEALQEINADLEDDGR